MDDPIECCPTYNAMCDGGRARCTKGNDDSKCTMRTIANPDIYRFNIFIFIRLLPKKPRC